MKMSTGELADEIKQIYSSDPSRAGTLIETHLEKRLNTLSAPERLILLKKLTAEFKRASSGTSGNENMDEEVLSRVFSLLLGREVSQADLSSTEFSQRLAESLSTIFDTLNQLVSVINMTLLGEATGDETIRHIIGFHLQGEDQSKSLETYLGQIKKAFLIAQQAYKKAAHTIVSKVLLELDPVQIARTDTGGLRFGPLRKAEFYEIYEGKFQRCKKWFESERFMEEFLREFEKDCQKLSLQ
jgi:hypothetical protein